MYAAGTVHPWITEQAMALFRRQFGASELTESYWQDVRTGSIDEDSFPSLIGDVHPSLHHFWSHDANFNHPVFGGGQALSPNAYQAAARILLHGPLLSVATSGAVNNYDSLFGALRGTSYSLLGHAVHLIQDMSVPAHAHGDPHLELFDVHFDSDPFHDWVDGREFTTDPFVLLPRSSIDDINPMRFMQFGISDLDQGNLLRAPRALDPDYRNGGELALLNLFLGVVNLADDYETKDYPGQFHNEARGGVPTSDSVEYAAFTRTMLNNQARTLVPLAIRASAEVFRLFYGLVDEEAPRTGFSNLTSTDPAKPQAQSELQIDLDAVASDALTGDSGVGKDKLKVESRAKDTNGSWGPWTALPASTAATHAPSLGTLSGDLSDLSDNYGLTAHYSFTGKQGTTYAFRVIAEDGGGNTNTDADAKVYYVRIRKPGAAVVELLDRSGSMMGTPIIDVKDAAGFFTSLLDEDDYASIVSFASSASADAPLTRIDDDTNRQSLVQAIEQLNAGGGTAIGDGLSAALAELGSASSDQARAVVLLSDGESNAGSDPLAVADSFPEDVLEYTIVYGTSTDTATLQQIASRTGGKFYSAGSQAELQEV
jgi:Mg-chelatase subunit ChlD